MFERYSERGRRTIFFARYEASQYGCDHIEAEHILLGIFRADKDLETRFLPAAAPALIRNAWISDLGADRKSPRRLTCR